MKMIECQAHSAAWNMAGDSPPLTEISL